MIEFIKRLFGIKPCSTVKPETVTEWPGDPEELRSRLEWSRNMTKIRKEETDKFHNENKDLLNRLK